MLATRVSNTVYLEVLFQTIDLCGWGVQPIEFALKGERNRFNDERDPKSKNISNFLIPKD